MARPTASSFTIGLALLQCATVATAANPLGFAVAAAPSMFVLAVAQAAPDSAEGRAMKAAQPAEAEAPRQLVQAPSERDTVRSRRADPKHMPERSEAGKGADGPGNERRISLR